MVYPNYTDDYHIIYLPYKVIITNTYDTYKTIFYNMRGEITTSVKTINFTLL